MTTIPPSPTQLWQAEYEDQWRRGSVRDYIKLYKTPRSFPPEQDGTLAARFQRPRAPDEWFIEDLARPGQNILLVSRYKAGKTTLLSSLAHSLADGKPFLGRFQVTPPAGNTGIFDYEMEPDDTDIYLQATGVISTERIAAVNLKGYHVPFATDPHSRAWVEWWLQAHQVSVWPLDTLTELAIQHGISLRSDEIGTVLKAVNEIKTARGISNVVITSHIPHNLEEGQERAYGDQSISAWADVIWTLSKDEYGRRFFSAEGRRVHLDPVEVTLENGCLTASLVEKKQLNVDKLAEKMMSVVTAREMTGLPMISKTDMKKLVGGKASDQVAAFHQLESDHRIKFMPKGNAEIIYPYSHVFPD